jgi:hypothetical protein
MCRIIVLTIFYLSQVKHKSLQIDKLACRQQIYGHAEKKVRGADQADKQTCRLQRHKGTTLNVQQAKRQRGVQADNEHFHADKVQADTIFIQFLKSKKISFDFLFLEKEGKCIP